MDGTDQTGAPEAAGEYDIEAERSWLADMLTRHDVPGEPGHTSPGWYGRDEEELGQLMGRAERYLDSGGRGLSRAQMTELARYSSLLHTIALGSLSSNGGPDPSRDPQIQLELDELARFNRKIIALRDQTSE